MCFSEEYINQIVFKPDELIDNSFDIFIRNEDYQEIETAIDNMITKIKNLFLDNQELETLISNLDELGKAFKLTKTGISKTSNGIKCLASGNKIKHIPDNLKGTSINCHLAAFKRLEPLRSRCHSQKNLYFSRCPKAFF